MTEQNRATYKADDVDAYLLAKFDRLVNAVERMAAAEEKRNELLGVAQASAAEAIADQRAERAEIRDSLRATPAIILRADDAKERPDA